MTPIISPWIIWAISLCDGAKCLLVSLALIGGGFYIGVGLETNAWAIRKIVVAAFVLCFLLGCLIPSCDTAVQMLVSQNVTYERVETLGQTVGEIYEDIISVLGTN